MDFSETEEIGALRESLRRYVARECPPEMADRWDREDFIPREELRKLGDLGVCGACIPEEFGGLGHDVLAMVATIEELGAMVTFLGSPLSGYTTGTIITVDGGASSRRA